MKNSTITPRYNHRMSLNSTKRTTITVRDLKGERKQLHINLMSYYSSRRCGMILEHGRRCDLHHKTVHSFCQVHTEFTPRDVHLSHICHHAPCVNPEHLLLEPATVNLKRNNCRRECICGALPKCFE